MGFVQHIQEIILAENLSQDKAEEENEIKQGFAKNFLLCRLVRRSLGF
jgi:ribosomal protein L9